MRRVKITSRRRGLDVIAEVWLADHYWERLRGLLGRPLLRQGQGLLLRPCSSIHTLFMGYPLDIVFLDREGRILRIVKSLRPFHFALGLKGTYSTLELTEGATAALGMEVGDTLELVLG